MTTRGKPVFYANHPVNEMRERPLLMRMDHKKKQNEFIPIVGYSFTALIFATLFMTMSYAYAAAVWFSSNGGLTTDHGLFLLVFAVCSVYMLVHYKHCGEYHIQERRVKTLNDWFPFVKTQRKNAIQLAACMLATIAMQIKLASDFSILTDLPVMIVLAIEAVCLTVTLFYLIVEISVFKAVNTPKYEEYRLYFDKSSLDFLE